MEPSAEGEGSIRALNWENAVVHQVSITPDGPVRLAPSPLMERLSDGALLET
jgi:hypothetical protein